MNNPTVSFGKYKDCKISEIPSSYIVWMLENVSLSECDMKILKGYLCKKLGIEQDFITISEQTSEQTDYAGIYKKLAKKYHPDCIGGNTEAMQAINEYYQLLKNK